MEKKRIKRNVAWTQIIKEFEVRYEKADIDSAKATHFVKIEVQNKNYKIRKT